MVYAYLVVIGLVTANLLIGNKLLVLTQYNINNQKLGQLISYETIRQANLSTFSPNTLSNISCKNTPGGNVNIY